MSTYLMTLEHDEDGYWVADFPAVGGCHTQARTVPELLDRARDALAGFVADADAAVLEVDLVEVPDRLRRSLANYVGARDISRGEEVRRLRDLAAAARDLRERGWSLRDIAAIVDVSHGRISQLLDTLQADGFTEPRPLERIRVRAG